MQSVVIVHAMRSSTIVPKKTVKLLLVKTLITMLIVILAGGDMKIVSMTKDCVS